MWPPPGLQCQRSAAFYIWRSWALVRVAWAHMSPHWREGPCPALSGWIQPCFCQLIRAAVVPSLPGPFLPVHLHSKHSSEVLSLRPESPGLSLLPNKGPPGITWLFRCASCSPVLSLPPDNVSLESTLVWVPYTCSPSSVPFLPPPPLLDMESWGQHSSQMEPSKRTFYNPEQLEPRQSSCNLNTVLLGR